MLGIWRNSDTNRNGLPDNWQVKTIAELADTSSGGTPDRSKEKYYNGKIPWVKSGELEDNIIYFTEEKITEKGLRNSSAKMFLSGTLLVAMYGVTVGKTGLLAINATTNQAICAIIPKKNEISPVSKVLCYISRNHLIALSSGAAQPNISLGIIRSHLKS